MVHRVARMAVASSFLLLAVLVAPASAQESAQPASLPSLPELTQRCSPAVVTIQVEAASGQAQGSGVIVDSSGKVLTCNHVIAGAKSAVVKTWSGGYFPVEGVLGLNPSADLALLRLKAQGLPSVSIGDYSLLVPGEAVFVISSPAGVESTVSEGIVSGMRRLGDLPDPYLSELRKLGFSDDQTLIQFSAPTYFGSSGGPLFNMRGEVVGIVSLRFEADNIYFAFPAKLAEAHLPGESVIKFENVGQSALGFGKPNPRLGDLPASVGLLEPQRGIAHLKVPKSGDLTVRLPEGLFVNTASVEARLDDGDQALSRVTRAPAAGEFRAVDGGIVYFAQGDAGKAVTLTYDYNVQRVAILACVNTTDFPELSDMTRNAAADELRRRHFEVIPFAEVDAAVSGASINISATAFGGSDAVEPESIRQIASDTNAAVVIYSAVASGTDVSYNIISGAMPVQGTGVFLALFDGHTGKDLFTKVYAESRGVMFGGRRRGRESCVKNAPRRILDEYLGQHPD
ncbi:MAG: S1C family serine protease [Armatimonadota bacterium]